MFTRKTCQNVKPLRFRWNLRISCIEFWFDDVAETNKRFWNNNFGIYEHVMASNIHMFILPNCHFSVLNHWRLDDSSNMQKLSFKWIKWSFAIITRQCPSRLVKISYESWEKTLHGHNEFRNAVNLQQWKLVIFDQNLLNGFIQINFFQFRSSYSI